MSGQVDHRPTRDVLTSVLNGVPPYKAVENEVEERRFRKEQKRERDRERKRLRRAEEKVAMHSLAALDALAVVSDIKAGASSSCPVFSPPTVTPFSCYGDRPTIDIKDFYRSQSITPPPMSPLYTADYTPGSTPGPSSSSSTSRTSSKRPRTPDDDEDLLDSIPEDREPTPPPPPKKRRTAARKGWKGWAEVEGSPEPSERLISLDIPPVLQERRTRSGKNFDAIGVGKDSWVNC